MGRAFSLKSIAEAGKAFSPLLYDPSAGPNAFSLGDIENDLIQTSVESYWIIRCNVLMKKYFSLSNAITSICTASIATVSISMASIAFNPSQTLAAERAPEPSSDIPDKREFPISSKLNPCDDFHAYVCSEVERSFKLPDKRSSHVFSFSDSFERILKMKKDFFAQIDQEKLTPRTLQIKNVYKACMNESKGADSEKQEIQEQLSYLNKIETAQEFLRTQVDRMAVGNHGILDTDIDANKSDPDKVDFYVYANLMLLPDHSYYDNPELMEDYKKILTDFFQIMDPQEAKTGSSQRAERVIALQKEFIKTYPKPEVRRQRWSESRTTTQADFIKKYPQLEIPYLFKAIPQKTLIFDSLPESLVFLNEHLTTEKLADFKDFYLVAYVMSSIDNSYPEFFKKIFDFRSKYLGGPAVRPPLDERCTRLAGSYFPKELDQVLIQKHFSHFPEKKFTAVADKIRGGIIAGLEKNQWLEAATKSKAIEKIRKANLYLVQPRSKEEWNFRDIQKFSDTDKIKNTRLFSKSNYDYSAKILKTKWNHKSWGMGPLTVNAYYSPSGNKFVMPMGILQYPFFNAEGDLIENLGAVGAVIGHELGHGIDDQGSKYDEVGRLQQWMTMKDLTEFSKRGQKMIEQFNQAQHNGKLTLGENIGDLVGLTFAYNAAFPDGNGPVADKQKLFIAYGRLWCNVARPKFEEQQLKTDPHALGRARINEQVKHQKGFAEAFSCKAGDKMTLPDSDRVQIW